MLNVHYVVPAKMPEVIGRTVSFTISFLEGEGEPERPDRLVPIFNCIFSRESSYSHLCRPREIMARLLGRIIEKLANPAGLVDLVFACIQLPTVVKLLSRLSTAICLPSLEPIEQSLLNPLLQLMTALVRIVGKFAFASVSGAGDILVSSMDAICTCIERYKLDRKVKTIRYFSCVLVTYFF